MEKAESENTLQENKSGTIAAINPEGFDIKCGEGFVRILACQPESKKKVSAPEFVNGHQVKTGEILGDNN